MPETCPMHGQIQRAIDRLDDWHKGTGGEPGAAQRLSDAEGEIVKAKFARYVTEDMLKKAFSDFKIDLLKAIKGRWAAARALAPWFATACATGIALYELARH